HALGASGHVAEEAQGLVIRLVPNAAEHMAGVEDVVVHPYGGKPQGLGPDGEFDHSLHVVDAPVVVQRDTNVHGMILLLRGKGAGSAATGIVNLLIGQYGCCTVWYSCRTETARPSNPYKHHDFPAAIVSDAGWL